MRFRIPGKDINVRLFERVATTDSQYDIFDVGVEQADGSIDSIVVGGSFSYAKSLVKAIDKKAEEKKISESVATPAPAPVAAPQPVAVASWPIAPLTGRFISLAYSCSWPPSCLSPSCELTLLARSINAAPAIVTPAPGRTYLGIALAAGNA